MIKVVNLEEKDSVFNNYIAEMRNVDVQNDKMRFRKNLERLGSIIAYEISKELEYKEVEITTLLGIKNTRVLAEQPVLGTIMRAGLPMHQGMLNVFDAADNVFVAAYRKYDKNEDFEIRVEYYSAADIEGRVLILCDPMLATGSSMVKTIKGLLQNGSQPKYIHIACAIASTEGIDYLKRNLGRMKATLWVGSVDEELTAQAYIVPGLGDAGDLAYGLKE